MSGELAVSLLGLGILACILIVYAHVWLPARVRERLRQSVRAFSRAIELRFPSHSGQTARVLELGMAVAQSLGLSSLQRERLELACQLRDIGLCAVPYKVGKGRAIREWTPEEREAYGRHPEISAAILERIPTLASLAEVVREHHKDHGESAAVPIESRILRAVAEYAWLERIQGEIAAREDLREGEGVRYDPVVVRALEQVLTSARGAGPEPAVT